MGDRLKLHFPWQIAKRNMIFGPISVHFGHFSPKVKNNSNMCRFLSEFVV